MKKWFFTFSFLVSCFLAQCSCVAFFLPATTQPIEPRPGGHSSQKAAFLTITDTWSVESQAKEMFSTQIKTSFPPTPPQTTTWGFSDNYVNFSPKTGKVFCLLILLRIQILICGYCFAGLHFEVNFGRILIPNFRHILGFKLFDATCLTFQCHWRRKINETK